MKLKEKLDEKVYEILLELVEEACIPEGISTEKACKKITELITHTYTPAILEELKMEKKDKEEAVNKELSSGNFSHTDEIIADIDGYNAAVEELDAKITTLQEDKPRKKRGIGRSQEEL